MTGPGLRDPGGRGRRHRPRGEGPPLTRSARAPAPPAHGRDRRPPVPPDRLGGDGWRARRPRRRRHPDPDRLRQTLAHPAGPCPTRGRRADHRRLRLDRVPRALPGHGQHRVPRLAGTLNYLDVAAQVGIIATSVALLMIAGEFDLSIGSMVGFAGIIIGIGVTIWGLPVWLSILLSMALTTFLGVVNGFIVVRTGLPSFIVTLATLFIIRGFSSVLTSSVSPITYIPIDPTLHRRTIRSPGSSASAPRSRIPTAARPASRSRSCSGSSSPSSAYTCSAGRASATGSPASAVPRRRPATSASRSRGSRSRCSP